MNEIKDTLASKKKHKEQVALITQKIKKDNKSCLLILFFYISGLLFRIK